MSAPDNLNTQQFGGAAGEPSREAQLAEFRRFQTSQWAYSVADSLGFHGDVMTGKHYPSMHAAAKGEGFKLTPEEAGHQPRSTDPHAGMLDIDPEHPGKLKRRPGTEYTHPSEEEMRRRHTQRIAVASRVAYE